MLLYEHTVMKTAVARLWFTYKKNNKKGQQYCSIHSEKKRFILYISTCINIMQSKKIKGKFIDKHKYQCTCMYSHYIPNTYIKQLTIHMYAHVIVMR